MDPKLTLESAKKATRQREAVREQQQTLQGGNRTSTDVDAVHWQRRGRPKQRVGGQRSERRESQAVTRRDNAQTGEKCSRCGRERHPREKCPARDAQCHNCKRKGHYSAQCHQRAVSSIQDGETNESAFLDTVSSGRKSVWIVHIAINGTEISFKLDTGAEVTGVSKQVWEALEKTSTPATSSTALWASQESFGSTGTVSLSPRPLWEGSTSTSLCHKQPPDQSIGAPCDYYPTAGSQDGLL